MEHFCRALFQKKHFFPQITICIIFFSFRNIIVFAFYFYFNFSEVSFVYGVGDEMGCFSHIRNGLY